ncbi:MAG: bifunctional aspartate kinase/homoserine dehydrogenase I [Mucinivorans sp.]
MKVIKFGGSSVGSVQGLENVVKIVNADSSERVVVVVSALGGVTDQLIAMATLASTGAQREYLDELAKLSERHYTIVAQSVESHLQEPLRTMLSAKLEELSNILRGVCLIQDLSPKTLAAIVSYGERMSSAIVQSVLLGSEHIDARTLIKTEPYFSRHIVDFPLTNSLIRERLDSSSSRVVVMGGFIASDKKTGEITNLGRGGSDYTAAIVASAMEVSALEICTDVDGFMTADPRVIDNAYLIEQLSFVEAMELCNFGAKVIYPPTIFPAYNKNIPIVIKNTFNYQCPGTFISRENSLGGDKRRAIKGISSINDTCMLTIRGLGMVGVIGVNYRIFKALAKSGVSVFLVSQASSENTTSIGIRNADAQVAVSTLSEEFAQEIAMGEIDEVMVLGNLATVAIVGENMKNMPGVAGKLFGALARAGINVICAAQGATETNISFVVKLEHLRKSMNVIHDSFFLSEYQVLNIFLTGIGFVGGNLIEQIQSQQKILQQQNALKINIVGISNSHKTIFNREGLDLGSYKELLASDSAFDTTPSQIADHIIRTNMFNSVFVDCTASAEVARIYERLLNHNVSVVTANKIAASGDYDHYEQLKSTARARGVKFLFETNVGAGLPIINTINDLRNSGDKILALEAVVSGTLNYIFNVLSADVPFSQAVRMAQQAGYAEPDPRIDLSGTDVIRKLVILSREAGYRIEQSDVEKHLFIPDEFFEGSLEQFWSNVPQLDASFEAERQQLALSGKRLRFVATMRDGRCSVGLEQAGSNSPFYNLEGSNNIILITTSRYREYPLQIKGYGAGASVTAAGVFADIMSIANIR